MCCSAHTAFAAPSRRFGLVACAGSVGYSGVGSLGCSGFVGVEEAAATAKEGTKKIAQSKTTAIKKTSSTKPQYSRERRRSTLGVL